MTETQLIDGMWPTESAKRNWQWLMMSGIPYSSWGFHTSIALLHTIRKPEEEDYKGTYLAVYMAEGDMDIIEQFDITSIVEHSQMITKLNEWNYHSLNLCPIVKIAMEDDA